MVDAYYISKKNMKKYWGLYENLEIIYLTWEHQQFAHAHKKLRGKKIYHVRTSLDTTNN